MEGVQMAPCRGKSASKLPLSNKLPVISLTEAGGRMWPAMMSRHQSSHIKMPFVQGACWNPAAYSAKSKHKEC